MGYTRNEDCCVEGSNPKQHPFKNRTRFKRGSNYRFFEIENPLPEQIKDTKELNKFFKQFPFVPFAGYNKSTAHTLLKKFIDYKTLSVTNGACIESIKTYSFGGKIEVVKSFYDEFDLGEDIEEVSRELKISFLDFLGTIDLQGGSWNSIACDLVESFLSTGNAYLEIVRTETGGVRYDTLKVHDSSDCLYVATEENEQKMIGISCDWTDQYLRENKPRIVPLYPTFFSYEEDDSIRSIIHMKNGNYKWYGRPTVYSALSDMYNEHQSRTYISKQLKKNFMPQLIMEIEEEQSQKGLFNDEKDKEAGFRNTADRMEQNYTNEGDDPTTLMILTRPYGSKQAAFHDINPNTNERYFKTMLAEFRRNIVMAHDWSEALLLKDKSSGFNSDMFMDILKIESATKILQMQNLASTVINRAIRNIALDRGLTSFQSIGLKFKSPIQKVIEQKNEAIEKEEDGNIKSGTNNKI